MMSVCVFAVASVGVRLGGQPLFWQTLALTARMRRARQTRPYRTTPLRAQRQHPPYFHDGRSATLAGLSALQSGS
jgi:hypothetical protein